MVFSASNAIAQDKKSLDHDAYEIWNQIREKHISPDGNWVMFSLGPENGDPELRIKNRDGKQTFTIPRADSARFSDDSHFAIAMVRPAISVIKAEKRAKKKGAEMSKDSLVIVNLVSGKSTRIPRVKSYKIPKENGQWLAYRLEKALPPDSSNDVKSKKGEVKSKKEKGKSGKKDRKVGTTLVLRNLESGAERSFENVREYQLSKTGVSLAFTVAAKDSSGDGVFAFLTGTGEKIPVISGAGDYKNLTYDKSGEQIAFLSNREEIREKQPAFALYHWAFDDDAPQKIAAAGLAGIPDGWWVSENGKLSFSENGRRVFFGTAPRPEPEPDEETPEDERIDVDIWHWKDPLIMPQQLKQLKKEQKRSYQAAADLQNRRVFQIANEEMPEVTVGSKGDADVAVAATNVPYRQQISWDYPPYYDVYLINLKTGERRLVKQGLQWEAKLSPAAKYLYWWDRNDSSWYAFDIKKEKTVNLTQAIDAPFFYEKHDWPFKPDSYGYAGWTVDDRDFLVYDKFDIWAIDPTGKIAPHSITDGFGRAQKLQFRYIKLDPDATAIDPNETMLLSAFQTENKSAGFYRERVKGDLLPEKWVMMPRHFSRPEKAEHAEPLMFTRENFREFPDVWISNGDFSGMQKISDANPQQHEYKWGTVEMVEWTSLDGIPLKGLLYKPEDFDFSKKYPMIVYFYEKYSDRLHRHYAPAPHRSIINFTFYASRGYLIFVPDIPYKIGYPGESALHAVLPGVTQLIKLGFVDEKNIGVQGHSWGGYQIAYLVTRTNIFKAAEAGAPVSNMFSAYGGIRWGSGMSRMFQYERTQSRIGGSIWEYPLRYIENSPIFWADRIETPLLIMHNDHDTAVPWYQGIELFAALRRLGKPVWLINYNGEPHWPTKYRKKRDWQIRLQQYFDHFLKGAPAPEWLEKGVPAIKKGKTLGLEPVTTE